MLVLLLHVGSSCIWEDGAGFERGELYLRGWSWMWAGLVKEFEVFESERERKEIIVL
jgi:hypothetical protein